jgi:hypothetical protein
MLELSVCLGVIGAMALAGAHNFMHLQRQLHVLEAVSMSTGPIVAMMEYRAVTGKWPASSEQAGYSARSVMKGGRLESALIRDGGAVDLTYSSRAGDVAGKTLSFRAWQGADAGLPVVWSCGHAGAPPLAAKTADRTTLAEDELASTCRGRHPWGR